VGPRNLSVGPLPRGGFLMAHDGAFMTAARLAAEAQLTLLNLGDRVYPTSNMLFSGDSTAQHLAQLPGFRGKIFTMNTDESVALKSNGTIRIMPCMLQ